MIVDEANIAFPMVTVGMGMAEEKQLTERSQPLWR